MAVRLTNRFWVSKCLFVYVKTSFPPISRQTQASLPTAKHHLGKQVVADITPFSAA